MSVLADKCHLNVIGATEHIIHIDGDEVSDTYIMKNGTQYKLDFGVAPFPGKLVKAELSIDGCHVGSFIETGGKTTKPIERPTKVAQKFTFYTVRAVQAAQQRLALGSRDAATQAVATSGIEPNDENGVIVCKFTPQKMINVFFKTLTGKTCGPVVLSPSDLIDDLKNKIQEMDGIPVDQQRLVFAGMQLEGGRTFLEYNMKDGCMTHLVLRVRGGATGPWPAQGVPVQVLSGRSAPQTIQGATTLQGSSQQTFRRAKIGELDHSEAITLCARLVGTPEVRPHCRVEQTTGLRSVCPPVPLI